MRSRARAAPSVAFSKPPVPRPASRPSSPPFLWVALGPRFGLYAVLYRLVPGFDLVRVPSRFATLTLLALGLLAGFGLERLARRRHVLAPLALVLVVGEFWAAPLDAREYAVEIPAIDRWLAAQPGEGAVVELPVADPRDTHRATRLHSAYMLHSTLRWRPLVNGYSGFTPAPHELLLRHLVTFPDERSLDGLAAIGVRYAVLHPGLYAPGDWSAVAGRLDAFAPGSALRAGAGRAPPAPPAPAPPGGRRPRLRAGAVRMSEPSPGSATGTTAAHVGRAFLYAAIVTAAAALPLVLWPFDSALIGDTYGRAYRPFELLGLTGSVAILLIAGLELRRREAANPRRRASGRRAGAGRADPASRGRSSGAGRRVKPTSR